MTHRRTHGILLVLWVLLALPTFLLWRDSVPWVVFMSWYAIVASHWAAFEAATPDPANRESAEEDHRS